MFCLHSIDHSTYKMNESVDRIVQFRYFIHLHWIKYPSVSVEQYTHECETHSSISNAIQHSIVAADLGLSGPFDRSIYNWLMIDVKRNWTMKIIFTKTCKRKQCSWISSFEQRFTCVTQFYALYMRLYNYGKTSVAYVKFEACKSNGTDHKIFKTENKSALNLSNWAQNAKEWQESKEREREREII